MSTLLPVALGTAFVAAAALFPVHIPRTKYSISVADIFVFAILALHGAPAAALAAGAEGLVGACRSSKRLTSRVSTPAAATATMLLCGLGYEWLHLALEAARWPAAFATLAALCLVALPYFAGTTLPLLAVMAAKNGQRLSLPDWAQNYSWLAAIYLMSAAVAGFLAINARQFGPAVVVLAARVADQQALVPVLAGIADEGSVDLPFPHHLGTAHVAHGFHEGRLVPAVGLGTRAGRVGRPRGVVRLHAELQEIEHHHRAVGAGITQCAHLIGRGVDGRIEIGGTEAHRVGPF